MEKNNTGLKERLRRVLRVPTWPCPMSLLLIAEGCQRLTRVDVDLAQLSLQTLANAAACVFHTEHAFTWTATSTPRQDVAQPSPSPAARAAHPPTQFGISASQAPRSAPVPLRGAVPSTGRLVCHTQESSLGRGLTDDVTVTHTSTVAVWSDSLGADKCTVMCPSPTLTASAVLAFPEQG